jgi:hypothetical protein
VEASAEAAAEPALAVLPKTDDWEEAVAAFPAEAATAVAVFPVVVPAATAVAVFPAEALYRGSRNREDRVAALPAESEAVVAAEEVEEADFEPPSTPAYLAGNQHVLLRHNRPFSVFVQPELQAAELLPVGEAEPVAVAGREWVHADQKDHAVRVQEVVTLDVEAVDQN